MAAIESGLATIGSVPASLVELLSVSCGSDGSAGNRRLKAAWGRPFRGLQETASITFQIGEASGVDLAAVHAVFAGISLEDFEAAVDEALSLAGFEASVITVTSFDARLEEVVQVTASTSSSSSSSPTTATPQLPPSSSFSGVITLGTSTTAPGNFSLLVEGDAGSADDDWMMIYVILATVAALIVICACGCCVYFGVQACGSRSYLVDDKAFRPFEDITIAWEDIFDKQYEDPEDAERSLPLSSGSQSLGSRFLGILRPPPPLPVHPLAEDQPVQMRGTASTPVVSMSPCVPPPPLPAASQQPPPLPPSGPEPMPTGPTTMSRLPSKDNPTPPRTPPRPPSVATGTIVAEASGTVIRVSTYHSPPPMPPSEEPPEEQKKPPPPPEAPVSLPLCVPEEEPETLPVRPPDGAPARLPTLPLLPNDEDWDDTARRTLS